MWGKDTGQVEDLLLEKHAKKARVHPDRPGRRERGAIRQYYRRLRNFHGRGGLGAVMGSKNLRAVVVRGTHRKLKVADPEGLNRVATWFSKSTKGHPAIGLHHELGTAKGIVPVSVSGILPTYNFQDGSFAGAEKISGETIMAYSSRCLVPQK